MPLLHYNAVVQIATGIKLYVFASTNCAALHTIRDLLRICYPTTEQHGVGLGVIAFVIGVKAVDGIVYPIRNLSHELLLHEAPPKFGNFAGRLPVGITGWLGQAHHLKRVYLNLLHVLFFGDTAKVAAPYVNGMSGVLVISSSALFQVFFEGEIVWLEGVCGQLQLLDSI